jgi:indolepyruvate ferredoxin oxidoreductase beta subunit
MKKTFNLIISGYGGQGIITIAEIIAKAAMSEGYEAKESELHGLAQRGGSLDCHVRFGEKVYSPLVGRGNADLIISLEALEALRSCYWANEKTAILVNSKAFNSPLSLDQIMAKIKQFTSKIYTIDADKIVEKMTGDITMVNTFILGYALKYGLLPLKKEGVWKAIAERIRPQFIDINKKVFDEAFK